MTDRDLSHYHTMLTNTLFILRRMSISHISEWPSVGPWTVSNSPQTMSATLLLVAQEASTTASPSPATKMARTRELSPSASELGPMTSTSFEHTTLPSLVIIAGTSLGNSSRNVKQNEKERSKNDWLGKLKRKHLE